MNLIFRPAAVSDLGLGRGNNEDAAVASRHVLAVADGMGGLPAGEVASEIVIRALTELDQGGGDDPEATLKDVIEAANREIHRFVMEDPARSGMGTTLTALLLSGDRLGVAQVGDSRCYLLRDGELSQVTRDDTLVQALVDRGVLSPEDARNHPQRSLVTNALQGEAYTVATPRLRPRPGDRFLLCSDGLSDVVDDEAIGEAMRSHPDRQQCVELLVKLAVQAGAPDNVTVIVADVETAQ